MTPENEKARKLLFSFLTPEQQEGFLSSLGFIVIGERTKHRYKLGFHGGLSVFDDQFSYCINLAHNKTGCYPPYEDHILAQKIVLETDELYFLRTAHRSVAFNTPLRFTWVSLGEGE
jgi:hypothetical protein